MDNLTNRTDSVLKTKEDLQNFVLVAFVLFILFVKCYMLIVNPTVGNTATTQRNAEVVKTHATNNI
ncbi:hypothetical protein ACFQZS_15395 [Mucilaginibacter calamicampi]|uniref:Uncharacterized protein n=1 Tax=Mucilaginibacter calamicampi TaxID=1302352 RepID=A0ABW2YZQ2_9SPHI